MFGLRLRLVESALLMVCLVLPASAAEPVIKLLDAGSGATEQLRYSPKVGSTEQLQVILNRSTTMDMGKSNKRIDRNPPVEMLVQGTVASIESNGNIHYTFKLTGNKLLPPNSKIDVSDKLKKERTELAKKMAPSFKKLVGTTGEIVLDSQGYTVSTKITPPSGVEEVKFVNLRKALYQTTAIFPSEAIGVGAKWTVVQDVHESGLLLEQTTTYTLVSHAGSNVEVKVDFIQTASEHSLQMKNLPAGTTADLVAVASEGTGTTKVQLDHLFPESGALSHGLETRVVVTKNGQVMNIGTTASVSLSVKRL